MQVDFYILAENSRRDINRMVCQLCEKAVAQQMKIFIYTKSIAQAQQLDDLLWSFKADSFLPHRLLTPDSEADNSDTDSHFFYPVIISSEINDSTMTTDYEFLINLSNQYSELFQNFKRIAEMVSNSPEEKQAARKRYRSYLDSDCSLNKYDL